MSQVTLKQMSVRNFKGLSDVAIDFSHITNVYGRNASGKTTLVDAFNWLLFGKDSQGNSDSGGRAGKFQVRPRDEAGADVDGVEIEVSATLSIDGELKVLSKKQVQKWTKKRGSTAPTLEGNINSFSVNGFPQSETEFKSIVADICDEELFKLLTNPTSFAALPWKKQRTTISVLADGVTDEAIIDGADGAYDLIAADVLEAGVDKARDKAMKTMKALKDEQERIPIRIDEASRSLVEEPLSADELRESLSLIGAEFEKFKATRVSKAPDLSPLEAVNSEISKLRMLTSKISADEDEKAAQAVAAATKKYNSLMLESNTLMSARRSAENTIALAKVNLEAMENERARLVTEFKTVRATAIADGDKVCPTCGREYPEEKLDQIVVDFNTRKKERLDKITEMGLKLKADIEAQKADIQTKENGLQEIIAEWGKKTGECSQAYEALQNLPKERRNLMDVPEYREATEKLRELTKKREDLERELICFTAGDSKSAETEQRYTAQIAELNRRIAVVDANDRTKARITELEEEQRDLAQKVADQEQVVVLIEEFIREKMQAVSEAVNKCFKFVRFRMFTQKYNGAIEDACVMQINSNGSYVDFWSANHAAQIAGGLDVISTLSRIHGITCPIFIDNREAITEIPEMEAQVINLYVSPEDKVLRIENE